MQSIMKADAKGAVHAPNSDRHNAATACGIVGGAWVNTESVVTCQTCIRIMVAKVSKHAPDSFHYRDLLREALDAGYDDVDGTSKRTPSEVNPTTFSICARGITLSIPYNDDTVEAYKLLWHELERLKDMVIASNGGMDKISIITDAGVYDGQ